MQTWAPPGYAPANARTGVLFESWAPPARGPVRFDDTALNTKSSGPTAPIAPGTGLDLGVLLSTDSVPAFPVINGAGFELFTASAEPCTRSCGGGWQHKAMVCVSELMGTVAPLDMCMAELGVADTRIDACERHECSLLEPRWEVGDWGPANASCGGAAQQRRVRCVRNGLPAEEADCGVLTHPRLRLANTAPCEAFGWYAGAWGECSAGCGPGIQRRSVTCSSTSGDSVPDTLCPRSKPRSTQPCYVRPCSSTGPVGNGTTAFDQSVRVTGMTLPDDSECSPRCAHHLPTLSTAGAGTNYSEAECCLLLMQLHSALKALFTSVYKLSDVGLNAAVAKSC